MSVTSENPLLCHGDWFRSANVVSSSLGQWEMERRLAVGPEEEMAVLQTKSVKRTSSLYLVNRDLKKRGVGGGSGLVQPFFLIPWNANLRTKTNKWWRTHWQYLQRLMVSSKPTLLLNSTFLGTWAKRAPSLSQLKSASLFLVFAAESILANTSQLMNHYKWLFLTGWLLLTLCTKVLTMIS